MRLAAAALVPVLATACVTSTTHVETANGKHVAYEQRAPLSDPPAVRVLLAPRGSAELSVHVEAARLCPTIDVRSVERIAVEKTEVTTLTVVSAIVFTSIGGLVATLGVTDASPNNRAPIVVVGVGTMVIGSLVYGVPRATTGTDSTPLPPLTERVPAAPTRCDVRALPFSRVLVRGGGVATEVRTGYEGDAVVPRPPAGVPIEIFVNDELVTDVAGP